MIAIEALWTDRFQRLRGVRKLPPEQDVEDDPDHAERDDHAEEPRVDLDRGAGTTARSGSAARRLAAGVAASVIAVPR